MYRVDMYKDNVLFRSEYVEDIETAEKGVEYMKQLTDSMDASAGLDIVVEECEPVYRNQAAGI